MPKNLWVRLFYALIVAVALILIGSNLYHRALNNALVAAVKARDVSAVRRLLAQGADPDCRYSSMAHGRPVPPLPVLRLAFNMLVDGPPNANGSPSPPNAQTEEIVLVLLRHDAKLQDTGFSLAWACADGDVAVLRTLLERGEDPNAANNGSAFDTAVNYRFKASPTPTRTMSTVAARAEVAHNEEVSQQMVQMLRQHGLHISTTQAQEINDAVAVKTRLASNKAHTAPDVYAVMFSAASAGDLQTLRRLLQQGVDPNPPHPNQQTGTTNDIYRTALDTAVRSGQGEAAKLLLAYGADPNRIAWIGEDSPLSGAAQAGELDMVKLLLAHGAKTIGVGSMSALESAIRSKHIAIVRYLLEHGASTATRPDSLPLLTLALRNVPEVAPDLLKRGVSVNLPPALPAAARNIYSTAPYSPLMAAVFYAPQYESILVRAGAKIGPDRPIICAAAARQNRLDLVPKLLAYGADINGTDAGDAALSLCVMSAPKVKMLLEHGANSNVLSHDMKTPLQVAALAGNAEVVRLLLAHGADANACVARGHTALYWAHKKNHTDIAALLQQAGGQE
jgi:uncharacterized protein